jgi:membrane protease subunit (stomatin/prohibitin family)
MALADVIKNESPDDSFFVWKYPNDEIKLASQLIVGEGQEAIFVKGGEALDTFGPGTHTLTTGNLPLINKIINLPFGGDTPFPAEIWFVATTVKRDLKWGTANPIPLMDKSIGFPVSVRAYGKWGVRIKDARSFLIQFVGSQQYADESKIHNYLIGEVNQKIGDLLGEQMRDGTPILEINADLNELSEQASKNIEDEFKKYGLEVVNFNIENINIPQDELEKIQEVLQKTFEAKALSGVELGQSYAAIKSFEILKDAATNESDGGVGAMMSAGIGLGAGLPLGQQMGQKLTVDSTAASDRDASTGIGGKLKDLKVLFEDGLINEDQYKEKQAELLDQL